MQMQMTLGQLAQHLNGEVFGDPNFEITNIRHPAQVESPSDLALILSKDILPMIEGKAINAAIVPKDINTDWIPNRVALDRPRVALAAMSQLFAKPPHIAPGIHPSSVVDPTADIPEDVQIGPLCSIGPNTRIGRGTRLVARVTIGADVTIGENGLFHPGVTIGDRVEIGNNVAIQPNSVIGGDGFSYVTPNESNFEALKKGKPIEARNDEILKIHSLGTVVLEDNVEIGANSCIDRGTLGATRIKKGTKIDNLVQIAHNVVIGENCLIVAQCGIAGSTQLGDRVVMAGQAAAPDNIKIGSDSVIMPQSGPSHSVPEKSVYFGSPALPLKDYLRREMNVKRIKSINEKVNNLVERMQAVEKNQADTKSEQLV